MQLKYFVLNPRSKRKGDPYAEASRQAMITYAFNIESVDPELAQELRDWAKREEEKEFEL